MTETNTETAAETHSDPTATAAPGSGRDAPADGIDEVKQLEALLAEAQAQAAAAKDQQLRAVAELDNVRKRAEREIATGIKYGSDRLLGDLLAVCDSLDLGAKAAAAPEATAKSIAEGLALTQKQFAAFLEKHGVKVVDPAGQAFNPDHHEAVAAIESSTVAPNHVIEVMQKGYRLHERLLRPAMVVVAKAKAG